MDGRVKPGQYGPGARYTEGLTDPQGFKVLIRCPFQHS